jgi:quercetin 2,3-dioxygenase
LKYQVTEEGDRYEYDLSPTLRVSLHRGADRHQTRIGWLHGRHSFDTGIDPFGADTHHGMLVVSNHDTIAPRSGFETHPHRNMEIVTWVLNGSLVHQDSEGHTGIIYPNLAQRSRTIRN